MHLTFVVVGIIALMMIGMIAAVVTFYKKPKMGQAIIRTRVDGTKVALNQGIMVVPILHRMEVMNVAMTMIHTDFMDENALISKDNIKVNAKINFLLRVNLTPEDILMAANSIGCENSFKQKALQKRYSSKFAETVKTVSKDLTLKEMQDYDNFKWQMLKNMDPDLNGYILDDCIIDYLKENKPQNTNSITA